MTFSSQALFDLFVATLLNTQLLNAHLPPSMIEEGQPLKQSGVKVLVTGEIQRGEGCIAAFKRKGFTVTTQICLESAKQANITPVWYRPNLNGPATITVPTKVGDPFMVIEIGGVRHYVLYKKPSE